MKAKTLFYIGFCSYLLILLFSSCGGSERSKRSGRAAAIQFDSIVVKKHIPLLHDNDTTLPYADVAISFIYPSKFRDLNSLKRLGQIFTGTFFGEEEYDSIPPEMAVDKYLKQYTERYQSLSNYYYRDKTDLNGKIPSWYWYYMTLSNKIMFQSDSLLSYAIEYSDYEGGAHGSYRIIYINIDLNKLEALTEEDLFTAGYFEPLAEKILHNLAKSFNVDNPESLLMEGFFSIEDILPNSNFYLDEEGIHYSYNQYEIAPYSMGVIDVTLPYSELKDILLTDGIIERYFLYRED